MVASGLLSSRVNASSIIRNASGVFKLFCNEIIPYFIFLFILALVVNTYVPAVTTEAPFLVSVSKVGLTITLFLIGAGLNFTSLKQVGIKPLLQGILLWGFIAGLALLVIMNYAH